MPEMNIIQAINDCLRVEMQRDSRVVVLGEDVGNFGGVFRATVGLQQEFGPDRCMDTPLAENGIVGAAIGMALYGLRPVAEIQFADYVYPAFDQIVNELAKMRYRSGGEYSAPVVIRMPAGGGVRGGHYHSQSPEAVFIHTPGLQVVYPSTPADTKGLLASAIRGEDPVIFLEPKRLYRAAKGEVPAGEYTVPIGQARVVRRAAARSERSVTILAWGAMVQTATRGRGQGRQPGLRHRAHRSAHASALRPRDHPAVGAARPAGWSSCTRRRAPAASAPSWPPSIQERALLHLEAPILRVTGFDTPFPYTLEPEYLPDKDRILDAIERVTTG